MATFRSIYTRVWREDDWFQSLPPEGKLFWFYLITNPSASVAGIYRLPARTMANEVGLPLERVTELLADFTRAGKIAYGDGTVWICRMREYQTGTVEGGRISATILTRIERDLADVRDCPVKRAYLRHYGYPVPEDDQGESDPSDTVAIPYRDGSPTPAAPYRYTDTETDTVNTGGQAPVVVAPPADPLAACLDYLRQEEGVNGQPFNPAAAVARLFAARFGDTYPPNYGRLGRLAGNLSGGYVALAQMIWSAPRVEGDPHDYLAGTVRSAPNRRRGQAQGESPAQPGPPDLQLEMIRRLRHAPTGNNGAHASGD